MKNNNDFLKKRTMLGLLWSFSDLILNQGIQFVIQIVLARLLLPELFGLIGMITVFIAISNSIIDSGFTNALIREEKAGQEDYSTVFYFNLLSAIIVYLILYMLSPIISTFFNQSLLKPILRILGLVIIINSFGLIQRTMLTKKIDFKTQTIINSLSSIVSGIIAIVLAYKGFGIWSLVFRMLFMQLMQSVLLCLNNRWIPSLVFNIKSFKRLFGFGWKILVSGLMDTIYNNLYYLIIGKFYTATDLGYYTNAQKLRDVSATSISTAVQKVTYPVLSSIQSDEDKLKNLYRKIIRSSVYITFPIMIGLAVIAKPLILLLFGENWASSIPYFKILCLAGMIYPLHLINLNILQVKGRSDLFLKLEILKKIVSITLIFLAIIFKTDILVLIWVMVLNSIICFFINSHYSKDIINYSTMDQIKDIAPIFLISIIMAGIVNFISLFLPNYNFIEVLIQIITGVLVYIIVSKLFRIEELCMILSVLKKIIKGN